MDAFLLQCFDHYGADVSDLGRLYNISASIPIICQWNKLH